MTAVHHIAPEHGIPRLIHLTWKDEDISKPLRRCVDSFYKLNLGWNVMFYTDSDCELFVKRYCPAFYSTYCAFPPGILRADAFRLAVLFEMGGVYADIDIECVRPLDELIAKFENKNWEIALTTDHPIHQSIHYHGRKMWMNDFMLARRRSRLLAEAMKSLESRAAGHFRPAEAVQVTGPGLLTSLIETAGGADAYGIQEIPWGMVHPLPDFALNFPEKELLMRQIQTGEWRLTRTAYAVHYWYHTWRAKRNVLTEHQDSLLQTDSEIVNERLQYYLADLRGVEDSVGTALAEFPETGGKAILDLSGHDLELPREGDTPRTLFNIARQVYANLGIDCVAFYAGESAPTPFEGNNDPCSASNSFGHLRSSSYQVSGDWGPFLSKWQKTFGLIDGRCDDSPNAIEVVVNVLSELFILNLVAEDCTIILEDGASTEQLVNSLISKGFTRNPVGGHLVLRRKRNEIPRIIHVIPTGLRGAPVPEQTTRWYAEEESRGWTLRRWDQSELLASLKLKWNGNVEWLTARAAGPFVRLAAIAMLLREIGGVVVSEHIIPGFELDEVLYRKRFAFFASASASQGEFVSGNLIASERGHPFWIGIEREIEDSLGNTETQSHVRKFLLKRWKESIKFLDPETVPQMVALQRSRTAITIPMPRNLTLSSPLTSRICNEHDFHARWLHNGAAQLRLKVQYQRKLWEKCFGYQTLQDRQMFTPGKRGLIFAAGADPIIVSALAAGCSLVVVDIRPLVNQPERSWKEFEKLFVNKSPGLFDNSIGYIAINPPVIDLEKLGEFDFVYSSDVVDVCSSELTMRELLASCAKLLRDNGVIVISFSFILSTESGSRQAALTRESCVRLEHSIRSAGCRIDMDYTLGRGDIETTIADDEDHATPRIRELINDCVVTSGGMVIEREASRRLTNRALPKNESRGFLSVGAGLGDVARKMYMSNSYELLEGLTDPTAVICYSHNAGARDFFRFHPNARNIVLFDMGHYYMSMLHDRRVGRRDINKRLFAACGFSESDQLAKRRDPIPIGLFHAPDLIRSPGAHIVVHPFGRGWGDWPDHVRSSVVRALECVSTDIRIYIVTASYVSADGRTKNESFELDRPNVTVLRNLSAPATFSLVASSVRFIGTMSALAQVAGFERIPAMILHPAACRDFSPPYSDYSNTILERNGLGVNYELMPASVLLETLTQFLLNADKPILLREEISSLYPFYLEWRAYRDSTSKHKL